MLKNMMYNTKELLEKPTCTAIQDMYGLQLGREGGKRKQNHDVHSASEKRNQWRKETMPL